MTNFGLGKVSSKTDTQHSNDHISSSFDDHYPAETIFLSKLCYTTDVVGDFSVQSTNLHIIGIVGKVLVCSVEQT
jgi:hypothetical protein